MEDKRVKLLKVVMPIGLIVSLAGAFTVIPCEVLAYSFLLFSTTEGRLTFNECVSDISLFFFFDLMFILPLIALIIFAKVYIKHKFSPNEAITPLVKKYFKKYFIACYVVLGAAVGIFFMFSSLMLATLI